jgi:hypothetical protein
LNHYSVRVEAMFAPDTDLRDAIERMIDPGLEIQVLVTLIAVYPDTAGRDAEEACRFAEALYRKDADRLGLPEPQAVIANLAEED